MTVILTCRQCGYRDRGTSEGTLMNRIKMWNHVQHAHQSLGITPSRVGVIMREDSEELIKAEQYRLQPSY